MLKKGLPGCPLHCHHQKQHSTHLHLYSLCKLECEANIWIAHQEQGLAHPVPAHPLCAQEQGNSLPQPCSTSILPERAPKSPGFLYIQHCEERKYDPISLFWSLFFHFSSTSWPAASLMPTPSSAAPNPPATSPQGSSAKPTKCLFVQGHLGSPEKDPDADINAEQTLPSHAPDLPHLSLLWVMAKRQEGTYPSRAQPERWQGAAGGSPQP